MTHTSGGNNRDKNHNQQVLNEGVYGKLKEMVILIGKGSVKIKAA